jgi:uncharacterized protein (DUF2336 family)
MKPESKDQPSTGAGLTYADVQRLMAAPTPDQKHGVAVKVVGAYRGDALKGEERAIAEEIFRLLARDVEVSVRQALAEEVRALSTLPHDVALILARDVDSVASPVLTDSPVLTEEDLIEIVNASGAAKQIAIANRAVVSERISSALIDKGNEAVVTTLVANPGARLDEGLLDKVMDRHGNSQSVQDKLSERPKLPPRIAERLVSMVTDRLRERMISRHNLDPDLATDLILSAYERAAVKLVGEDSDATSIEALARQISSQGRLTDALILRAACLGEIGLVEAALAVRAGVPVHNARLLLHDRGPLGLKSICEKASIHRGVAAVLRVAVEVVHENAYDGESRDRERFRRRMIERTLTRLDQSRDDLNTADKDYLLGRLARL